MIARNSIEYGMYSEQRNTFIGFLHYLRNWQFYSYEVPSYKTLDCFAFPIQALTQWPKYVGTIQNSNTCKIEQTKITDKNDGIE